MTRAKLRGTPRAGATALLGLILTVLVVIPADTRWRLMKPRVLAADRGEPAGPQAPCSVSLQSLVDRAGAGSVVKVPPCIYREAVTVRKPLTLVAEPGAEIRGSDIWSTGWTRSGELWQHPKPVSFTKAHGQCRNGTQRCLRREQAFYDGKPLLLVETDPTPGQFSLASGILTIADDPSGHVLEVATRQRWIEIQADGVTIQGFTMRHCVNDSQSGCINVDHNSGVTVLENTLSEAHGGVVGFRLASNLKLLRNDISYGDQEGVSMGRVTDSLIQGNRIHHNNSRNDFSTTWEAGGLKSGKNERVVFDGNDVYMNRGPGIWCDVDCRDVTYSNNRVHDNETEGIQYEISHGARIYGNVVWNNGWGFNRWGWGAGILVQNSDHSEVYDNIVAWNSHGISVIEQIRDAQAGNQYQAHPVSAVYLHDNTIVMHDGSQQFSVGWFTDCKECRIFDPEANNRGEKNAHGFSGNGEAKANVSFTWDHKKYNRLEDFSSTPGGKNDRYLSPAEQNKILSAAGVPLSPPPPPSFPQL